MKKYLVIAIIAILAGITNPSQADYEVWAKSELISRSDNVLEKGVVAWMGGPIIQNFTNRSDYILFSIYRTELDKDNASFMALGIFKNFIPLSAKFPEEMMQ